MTLWLLNIAAYSIQLALLVATGAAVAALLRLHAPVSALRFWQGILVTAVLWPAYQLWVHAVAPSPGIVGQILASIASSQSATPVPERIAFGSLASAIALGTIGVGAALRLAALAIGLVKLRAIREAATPACALAPIAGPMQQELGVTADIRISDAVTSPATFGARRPTVLLPPEISTRPPQVQRAVLYHELLHVQRQDWLAALGEEIWCAVLWFHPAARALSNQLSLARETVVDQATLACTRDRRAYAAALLEFSTSTPQLAGVAGLIGRRGLDRRISLISNEVSMTSRALALRLCVAALSVGGAVFATTLALPLEIAVHAQAGKVYKASPGSGVTLPQVIKEVKPVYTARAMQAKIQGTVWLQAVVLLDGDVGEVTVSKSLDKEYGLDDEAMKALRQWKFKPGAKDGKAVAVEVTVEMTFTLKK